MTMGGAAILLLAVAVIGAEAATSLVKRDYCRNRKPTECCTDGRQDDCSVPIQDSLCYCDHFCLQGDGKVDKDDDCCPDFAEVCLGEEPPLKYQRFNETAVCYYKGNVIQDGKSHTVNCNECLCKNGRLECTKHQCLIDDEKIRQMENPDLLFYTWTITNYSIFWGWKFEEGLRLRTGTFPFDPTTSTIRRAHYDGSHNIPLEFDARYKAEWAGRISGVRDQGWCGASWVFSTLAVAQDRHMILTGKHPISLAPQEVLSCSAQQATCNGGQLQRAWWYMRRYGAMVEKCYPYESGTSSQMRSCLRDSRFLECKKYRTRDAYLINGLAHIQWEIMTKGPVQAVMKVHRELFLYGRGVYQCPHQDTGEATATHSVRIVGWGVDTTRPDTPVDYWVVANSWGTWWGEGGFLRIRRGTNECGIESSVIGLQSQLDSCI